MVSNDSIDRMLQAGMGRAILLLLKEDLTQYRDLILDSCLHNRAYDPQCEGGREDYLLPLLKTSGELNLYQESILNALKSESDFHDLDQLLDFAVIFAKDGSAKAYEAVYDAFVRHIKENEHQGAEQIIRLDGIRGLVFVLEQFAFRPETDVWPLDLKFLIRTAEEQSSSEEVAQALCKAQGSNPGISVLLAKVDQCEWGSRPDYEHTVAGMSWIDLKKRKDFGYLATAWVKQASDYEFLKSAADPPCEENSQLLRAWLRLFWKRPYPLDPDLLIMLIDHPDEWTAGAALTTLSKMQHPKVRALALQFADDTEPAYRAARLFESNYEAGDHILMKDLLQKAPDKDRLHSIGSSAIEIFKANPVPEALDSLIFIYNNGPCSNCRSTVVELIATIGQVPEWMLKECLYDADEDLRNFARAKPHQSNDK